MFGVGYQEMFLIMVVALVIFGPGKLPEVAGQVGRAVRDFRRMTADLTGEFEKTIAEVDDVKQSVRKEVKSMRAEVEGVTKSVKDDLEGITDTKAVAAGATAKAVPAAKGGGGRAAAKPASAPIPVAEAGEPLAATKADPLADVSAMDDGPTPSTVTSNSRNGTSLTTVEAADVGVSVHGDANGAAVGVVSNGDGDALAAVAAGPDDAVARARRRRATAGYRRL